MKSLKIILSIVGIITFCVTSNGQLLSGTNEDILYYSLEYNLNFNRLEHHIASLPYGEQDALRIGPSSINLHTRTYFNRSPEAFWEPWPELEDWMTTPFESAYSEENLDVEDWMLHPFEDSWTEAEIEVEEWMSVPW